MAKLNHNPDELDDGFAPGVYKFTVIDIELRNKKEEESPRGTFASGNEGFTATIEFYSDKGTFNTWEHFVFVPNALFKLKQVCEAVGLDFYDDNLDSREFMGKQGEALLKRKPDSKYLTVDKFIKQGEEEVPF